MVAAAIVEVVRWHIISGALLPIRDKLEGVRVYRLQTDDGQCG